MACQDQAGAAGYPRTVGALEQAGAWREAAAESKAMGIACRWLALADKYSEFHKNLVREYMVARARRIWGRLGGLLKKSAWAKKWRNAYQAPSYVQRWVKVWRPM